MRGHESQQVSMLGVVHLDRRVPLNHPLRPVKALVDRVLKELSPLFDEMYAASGRRSIPPERLLKAMVLMALYTVGSERRFCEELRYNMLYTPADSS